MSSDTDVRLTSGQRLARGLKYSVVGPVDLTLGGLGVGLKSAASSASWLGGKLRSDEAVEEPRRRRLLWIVIGAVVLAGGAATFSIVRRSTRPDPSPLPPSVEVAPKP